MSLGKRELAIRQQGVFGHTPTAVFSVTLPALLIHIRTVLQKTRKQFL